MNASLFKKMVIISQYLFIRNFDQLNDEIFSYDEINKIVLYS